MKQILARDMGITVGGLPTGPRNAITDVAGVAVGHVTLDTPEFKTGVTALLPCGENPFFHKLPAASFVLNGFGKTQGLVQVDELGTLETPIALTGTLNVGMVHHGLVSYMVERCAREGFDLRSVNPVVCECNDGTLSHIAARPVTEAHVLQAIARAGADFAQGDVGAGKGMICHGLKGGIGSASRLMELGGGTYTLGVLALTNHGRTADLAIQGRLVGPVLLERMAEESGPDLGSCILILATDLPLDARQLGRVIRRLSVGLARLGSFIGQGSGEVFLGFSTANPFDPRDKSPLRSGTLFSDDALDLPFRAAAECAEEAVLNSMFAAHTVTGWQGKTVRSLSALWPVL